MDAKTLSAEELAELKRLMEAATPGPWYLLEQPWLPRGCETMILSGSNDPHAGKAVCDFECQAEDDEADNNAWHDAELIAFLRNHAPALIAAAERDLAIQQGKPVLWGFDKREQDGEDYVWNRYVEPNQPSDTDPNIRNIQPMAYRLVDVYFPPAPGAQT